MQIAALGPLRVPTFLAPSRPLPAIRPQVPHAFSADRLQLSILAQEPGLGDPGIGSLGIERSKIEHVSPSLSQLPDFAVTPLRIALELQQKQARFSLSEGQISVEGPQGRQVIQAEANGAYEAEAIDGGFILRQNGQSLGRFSGRLIVDNTASTLVVNGQIFRGDLELMPAPANRASFNVINPVLLEDYLLSVVPSESPASWPLESLRAQALAARTYAVANWGKHSANGFDMMDDTSDQMYKGVVSESPSTSEAVKTTAGQIITHGGKPITALFFSCSGGMTDSSLEVWGTDLPYIQPVKDFDQAASRYRWNLNKSQGDLQQAAQKLGHNLGTIREVTPLTHTPQGRVKTLRLSGTQGSVDVDANKFRFALGLHSTLWTVSASGSGANRSFSFNGGGWGHGLGMSQWGARQMAADGKDAAAIIHHYYQGVAIENLTPAAEATR